VVISIADLPWGDEHTPSGDNGDQHDFAGMDRDLEDNTEHAQYRQYSTNLGRWQSPDPYMGSYDFTNPQSFNRYTYALNDPANLLDPSGLDDDSGLTYGQYDGTEQGCGNVPGTPCGIGGSGGDTPPTGYVYSGRIVQIRF
jgi:RHS repeat-associated protein